MLAGEADIVVGSRFADGGDEYRPPLARRLGIGFFARIVSLLVRQRVTDTTSGFQALNRKGDPALRGRLPARLPGGRGDRDGRASTGCGWSRCRCGCASASTGRSSITALRSLYYVVKVLLALFVGLFRRYAVPLEERDEP